MAEEFTPITTQEAFDAAVAPLLQQERDKYSDYSALKQQVTENEGTIQTQLKTITDLQRTNAALKAGLPADFAARLTGQSAEDFDKDAAALAKLIGKPTHNPEPPKGYVPAGSTGSDGKKAGKNEEAFRELLDNMNFGGN